MRLKHYARREFTELDRAFDYASKRRRDDKPSGFWVSVEGPDDWREWCLTEDFCIDDLDNEFDVLHLEPGRDPVCDPGPGCGRE